MTGSRECFPFNCQHCGAAILRDGCTAFRCDACQSRILVPAAGDATKNVRFAGASLKVRSDNLPTRWGRYPFQVENADEPRLQRFREEIPVTKALRGARDEFAGFVNLRHLVREEWFSQRPSAAFLKRYGFWTANRLNQYWFCTHASRMFVLSATALGIPARVVNVARGVRKHENLMGHMVVDVWSNQFQKWVYMDVLFDFHYENKAGEPLDLIEARSLYFDKQAKGLYVSTQRDRKGVRPGRYSLGGKRLNGVAASFKERSANLFWGLFFHGQNYFSCPLEDRQVRILCYEDKRTKGKKLVGLGKEHYADEPMLVRTPNALDIYPFMNNAEIQIYATVQDRASGQARVYISTLTPNLKRIRFRVGRGSWKTYREDGFVIPWPRAARIEAQTENRLGRQGRPSSVQITMA